MLAVCLGDHCIDTYIAPLHRRFAGGSAVNVAVHLQRAGIATDYIGALGEDADGLALLERVRTAGVGVERVQVQPGQTAFVRIELSPQGEPRYIHANLPPRLPIQLSAADLDFIAGRRLVHTTWLGGTDAYLPELRRLPGLTLSHDFGPFFTPELPDRRLPFVDLAFFSLPASLPVAGIADPGAAAAPPSPLAATGPAAAEALAWHAVAGGASLAVVMLGRQGALACAGGQMLHQPAVPVPVVDTLGAGDAFIARVLAGYLRREPLAASLAAAAQAAAQVCTHYGAWEGAEIEA